MFDVGFGSLGSVFGGVFMVSLGEDRHSGFLAVFAKALSLVASLHNLLQLKGMAERKGQRRRSRTLVDLPSLLLTIA
jgi:hypothetical protein